MLLKEIATIKYGKNQSLVENKKGKYPIYGTSGVFSYANEFLYNKPSILIGRKGSIGNIQYVDKPFWCVDTTFYTEIKENIVIPKYLYYKLLKYNILELDEGTTVPSLRTETLNKINILIHNLSTQQHIVDTIGSVDDLIEKNEEIISNLENFGSNKYIKLINNEYKLIKISELNIKYGQSITEENREKGNIPMYSSAGLIDYINISNCKYGIILGCRGNSVGNVFFSLDKCFVLNTAFYFENINNIGNLYFALKYSNGFKEVATGSAQPQITIENLQNCNIKCPSDNSLNDVLKLINMYNNKNLILKIIKKILLSKYFD